MSAGKNSISHSLLNFKRRLQPDLDKWIDGSLTSLKRIIFPRDTLILRALQHDETIVRTEFPTALDILGLTLAERFGCHYLPSLLQKTRPTLACKYLTRDERLTELHDIYRIDPAGLPSYLEAAHPSSETTPSHSEVSPPSFLLIDDIFTTGTTMQMMIHALRESIPECPIRIFTLTRADYESTPDHPAPTPDYPTFPC